MNEVDPRGDTIYSTDLWDDNTNAVLGQLFDANTRSVYTTLTEDYCARKNISRKEINSTLEVMEIPGK